MKTFLFIDKSDSYKGFYPGLGHKQNVVNISNFIQFVDYINKNDIPNNISFTYNLGMGQYNGLDCIRYLIEYCEVMDLNLPLLYFHNNNEVEMNIFNEYIEKSTSTDSGAN